MKTFIISDSSVIFIDHITSIRVDPLGYNSRWAAYVCMDNGAQYALDKEDLARLAELVDAPDLKSVIARCSGSSPEARTI